MEESHLQSLNGHIHAEVGGFFHKFFGAPAWAPQAESIAETSENPWTPSTHTPSPKDILGWIDSFHDRFCCTKSRQDSTPDFFLGPVNSLIRDSSFDWQSVRLVGHIRDGKSTGYQADFGQLLGHANQVFAADPHRLFLHGVFIWGTIAELWVFDRSRFYTGPTIDLATSNRQFVHAMAGYTLMSEEELGILNFVTKDHEIMAGHSGRPVSIALDPNRLVSPTTLLGRGVTVYRSKENCSEDQQYVVKFVWRKSEETREERFLRLVQEKAVWGVVALLNQEIITTMADLHQGLKFGAPRRFISSAFSEFQKLTSRGITDHSQPCPEGSQSNDNILDDLVLSCVITFPLGKKIYEFSSIIEFLESFRDAIKAHQSLYLGAGLLHQDISANNIIITKPKTPDGPKGILIDLDAALDTSNDKTKPGQITGTKMFMAIGVLQGHQHTYRHDLESFLYVLIIIAVYFESMSLPDSSCIQNWFSGDWNDLAQHKLDQMTESGFRGIVSEFSPKFRELVGLAEDMRSILFPIRDRELFIGTDHDPESVKKLYASIVNAFNSAIKSHGHESVPNM